jgi:two-component system, OmpR family, sensor kinase
MQPSPRGHRWPAVVTATVTATVVALLAIFTVASGPAAAWPTTAQVRPAPAVDAGPVMRVQATSQSEMSEIREALGQMRQEMQEMREAVRAAREASERAADAAERAADAAEASADAARQAAEGR